MALLKEFGKTDSDSREKTHDLNEKDSNSNTEDLEKKLEFLEKELLEKEKLLAEKEKQLAEFKDLLQKLQADFENFSKRIEKEKSQFVEFANAKAVFELLPLLDSFDSAIKKLKEQNNENQSNEAKNENLKKTELDGIELLQRQFLSIVEKLGLKEIECVGEKFNHEFEECLLSDCVEGKDDEIVLEELQKGYFFKGKVLRHAKVKINKKEIKENEAEKKGEKKNKEQEKK